ncbi:DUF6087 family protein [Streptomyces sclerotialus]|uniref:DUF6087 family protein n=1 Tax=Streptomyces sclerotialus TaxID=1957 RepID=UPI0034A1E11F
MWCAGQCRYVTGGRREQRRTHRSRARQPRRNAHRNPRRRPGPGRRPRVSGAATTSEWGDARFGRRLQQRTYQPGRMRALTLTPGPPRAAHLDPDVPRAVVRWYGSAGSWSPSSPTWPPPRT